MSNDKEEKRSYIKEREIQIKQLEIFLKKIEVKKDDTNNKRRIDS